MQHFRLRCKHCQKEYTYCTYGNGPEYGTEEGCSMEYCAECQKAIDKALGKIPVKFDSKQMEIKEDRLFPLFEKIKTKIEEERKKSIYFNTCICVGHPEASNYDIIEEYHHDGIHYFVKWLDESPEDKHIFVDMEYDIKKNKFTGQPWKYDDKGKDYYTQHRNMAKDFVKRMQALDTVEPIPMFEPPKGILFFVEPVNDWKLTSPKTPPRQRSHELRQFDVTYSGGQIPSVIEHGWYQTTVRVAQDVDVEHLNNFLNYNCVFVQYDDEDFATLIDIKCV